MLYLIYPIYMGRISGTYTKLIHTFRSCARTASFSVGSKNTVCLTNKGRVFASLFGGEKARNVERLFNLNCLRYISESLPTNTLVLTVL